MPHDYDVRFNLDDCIKALGLDEMGRVQTFVTEEVKRLSEPYVPFDIVGRTQFPGQLKNSVDVQGTDVVWHTPYARRLYYHPEYNFQGSPMRGGNWVDRMLQNGGLKQIENGARRIANR